MVQGIVHTYSPSKERETVRKRDVFQRIVKGNEKFFLLFNFWRNKMSRKRPDGTEGNAEGAKAVNDDKTKRLVLSSIRYAGEGGVRGEGGHGPVRLFLTTSKVSRT